MKIRNAGPGIRGHVTFTETDDDGNVMCVVEADNAFTDGYASFVAQVMGSGGAPSMPLTHISLGCGGFKIDDCDSITGWASTPTLDNVTYKQGTGSLSATQTLSTSGTYARYAAIGAANATGGAIEVWLRLTARGTFDLANSQFRVYTNGSNTKYYYISLSGIESLLSNFVDATWKLCRIPLASFTGSGGPDWTAVTGSGVVVAANAGGSATLKWDDIRQYPAALPVDKTQTAVADQRSKTALSALVYTGPLTVTATAYWTSGSSAAGTYYVAGLWGGTTGATLAAIVGQTFTKTVGYNLTVTWTLTFGGG